MPLPPALAGQAVRVVIDPVPALGTTLEVLRVGPLMAPLPGWTVDRGLLDVAGARGRRTVRVTDAPLRLTAPAYRPPAGTRALLVDVRGDGILARPRRRPEPPGPRDGPVADRPRAAAPAAPARCA